MILRYYLLGLSLTFSCAEFHEIGQGFWWALFLLLLLVEWISCGRSGSQRILSSSFSVNDVEVICATSSETVYVGANCGRQRMTTLIIL